MVFIIHKHKDSCNFIKEPINLKYFLAYVIYSKMFSGQKKPKKIDPEKQCNSTFRHGDPVDKL